jgi:glucokinase
MNGKKRPGDDVDLYLGIDVVGTKIAAGLVTAEGVILERRTKTTDQGGADASIAQLICLIRCYERFEMKGIGIGVPGIAESRSGLVWAPNIRGWDYIPLAQRLSAATGVPPTVESDRNTGVLGELLFGAARGCRDVVYLILGTGIGAGIVTGGRLLRGAHDIGGAVGWIPVVFAGKQYHLEEVAAGPGILRHAAVRNLPDEIGALTRRAACGDEAALRLFREVGEALGQGLAILVSVLDPELMLLGGGVSRSWEWLRAGAEDSMGAWSQPEALKKVQVQVSRLGVDAGILGAAAAARLATIEREGGRADER